MPSVGALRLWWLVAVAVADLEPGGGLHADMQAEFGAGDGYDEPPVQVRGGLWRQQQQRADQSFSGFWLLGFEGLTCEQACSPLICDDSGTAIDAGASAERVTAIAYEAAAYTCNGTVNERHASHPAICTAVHTSTACCDGTCNGACFYGVRTCAHDVPYPVRNSTQLLHVTKSQ